MLRQELINRSPIRILEKSIHGGLGKGNLGVFTARKGVGKTACLVHVSIDKILRDQKVLHISFAEDAQHIESWYEQVFREVAKSYKLENILDDHNQVVRNRMILHLKQAGAELPKVRESILRLCQGADFCPEVVIVDGFSLYDASEEDILFWKALAAEMDTAVWFSATMHRDDPGFNEHGIPMPVNRFQEHFTVIIVLEPKQNYIALNLLKDQDNLDQGKLKLKLDTRTLLISNHRV